MKKEDVETISDLYFRTIRKAKKGLNYSSKQMGKLGKKSKEEILNMIEDKSKKNRKVSRSLARISNLMNPDHREYLLKRAKEKAEKAYTKMLLGKKVKDKNGKVRTIMPKNVKLSI